jgi:hypothetical protein
MYKELSIIMAPLPLIDTLPLNTIVRTVSYSPVDRGVPTLGVILPGKIIGSSRGTLYVRRHGPAIAICNTQPEEFEPLVSPDSIPTYNSKKPFAFYQHSRTTGAARFLTIHYDTLDAALRKAGL